MADRRVDWNDGDTNELGISRDEALAIDGIMARTWEVLPAGTFKAEGTRADVVLLTIKGV